MDFECRWQHVFVLFLPFHFIISLMCLWQTVLHISVHVLHKRYTTAVIQSVSLILLCCHLIAVNSVNHSMCETCLQTGWPSWWAIGEILSCWDCCGGSFAPLSWLYSPVTVVSLWLSEYLCVIICCSDLNSVAVSHIPERPIWMCDNRVIIALWNKLIFIVNTSVCWLYFVVAK